MRLSRDGQPVRVQAPGEGLPAKSDAGKGEAPKGADGKQAAEPAAVQGASKS